MRASSSIARQLFNMRKSTISNPAQSGFAAATQYDAYRPSFIPKALAEFLFNLEIHDVQRAKVIDLAAGTGKFTELLAARPEHYEVTAIEPHAGMREVLEKKKLRNTKVIDGTAEDMSQIQSESFDALVAAQSWHWFANMSALKEINRVLKPRGVFGMIWNIEDYNAPQSWTMHTKWEKKLNDIIWSYDDNHPRFRHEKWKAVFDEQNKSDPVSVHTAEPLFGLPIGESSVDHETWLSKEEIWNRYRTLSQIAILEGEELEKVRKTYWDAINASDVEVDEQGRVAVHVRTFFAWTSKIPAEPFNRGEKPV